MPARAARSRVRSADVAVAFRNLKELPPDDAVMHLPETEPPEAPPAGVHYVGDRVKVERSNGSISYATIVEYDEVMEVYTVDVGGGVLKYGVEESYITHVDHTGEWAGKHFIGRKVRPPPLRPPPAARARAPPPPPPRAGLSPSCASLRAARRCACRARDPRLSRRAGVTRP